MEQAVGGRLSASSRMWIVLLTGGTLVGLLGVRLASDSNWLLFFENFHWTTAAIVGALAAWLGARRATVENRRSMQLMTAGFFLYAIGQLVWDLQVWMGYIGFPSPSDLFYGWLGPCLCIGLLHQALRHTPARQRFTLLLDCALMAVASLTLVLALYLPRSGDTTPLALFTLIIYPATLFTALGVGLVMIPSLHLKLSAGYLSFLAGLLIISLCWIFWNLLALRGGTETNSLLNSMFSVSIAGCGIAMLFWRLERSTRPGWVRLCEGLLRLIPLVAVIAACTGVAISIYGDMSRQVSYIIVSGATAAIALAFLRQRKLLQDFEALQTATERAERSEKLNQIILKTLPDMIWMKDANGVILMCNPSVEKLYSIEEGGLLGKTDYDFNPPELAHFFRQKDLEAMLSGGPSTNEEWVTSASDGRELLLETVKIPVFDADGTALGVMGIARDITARHEMENALKENETRLRLIGDNLPAGYVYQYEHDSDGKPYFLYLSAGVERVNGVSAQAVMLDPRLLHDQIDPHQIQDVMAAERESAQNLSDFAMDVRMVRPDGEERWLHLRSHPHRRANGSVVWDGIAIDFTQQRRGEERLRLAARVFSDAHEGIIIATADLRIIDVNPFFSSITGYSREEAIGHPASFLYSPDYPAEFYDGIVTCANEHGFWQGDLWQYRKNGEHYAVSVALSVLRDEQGAVVNYICLISDITHIKYQQETLELMAHYDALTRLPNRVLFADRFKQAIAHSKRDNSLLAVCYLDLDGFKQVNDQHGHETGDQLLIEAARRIQSCLREEDTISRMGGDEFALLLGNVKSVEQVEGVMTRIHRSVSQPYKIDDKQMQVAVSSGVTLYPLDDADPDTLIRHADQAMYRAKQEGRNRFFLFDPARDLEIRLHRDLQEAIERGLQSHEFCLYYQPKVNMRSGAVVGVEALLRWNHPQRGLLLPMDFLPLVAGAAQEQALGEWTVREALQQMQTWREAGLDLKVSINVSSRHLQQRNFIAQLNQLLCQHDPALAQQLELEVSEIGVPEDVQSTGKIIDECSRSAGVAFALDDFGTGNSSLSHLRHLPVHTIKIDHGFVRNMIGNVDDHAIVAGLVGLASAFHRDVMAEGVETPAHGAALLKLGCELGQGYGIARPMPADQIPGWVQTGSGGTRWVMAAASFH